MPAARVFSVADTFDALTTDRPYRSRLEHGRAREIIAAAAGTQFDPAAVEAFLAVSDGELERIAQESA